MPPGIVDNWDDNNIWSQSMLIAYSQIRDYEDQEDMVRKH